MNNVAIKVENLNKTYKLYNTPFDRLKEALHLRGKKYHKDFYALRNVGFEINKGEIVGIIGKNGSGKSTLLKIITGVLTPTSGSVTVNGRISALLELGAGFNPEYTGIENIRFQGNLMGFEDEEMNLRIEQILEFAEIGDFIYQPVKSYSSGMFARLAFAVAVNVDPDILIVDEALAVGDMVFQAKCMARMTMLMESGVTVLFVSHDTHSIKTLCQKAVFLDHGELRDFGSSASVTNKYIEMQHLSMGKQLKELDIQIENSKINDDLINKKIPIIVSLEEKAIDPNLSQRYGDGRATILNAVILNKDFAPTQELVSNNDYYVQIAIRFNDDLETFVVGAGIVSLDGLQQLVCLNSQDGIDFPSVKKGEIYIVNIKMSIPIKAGTYTLTVAVEFPSILNQQHQMLDVIHSLEVLRVNFENQSKIFHSMFYTKGEYSINNIKSEKE